MDAAWNDDLSPYDVLGVSEKATDEEIRQAYRDLAKLFHPDRNFGLGDETANRTKHFLKIKKAYEALADEGSRRLYDGCLVARERLVRKNIYKYAVSNTSEFRDVVDEQFREAVLDPEREIDQAALVLCCDSCGAPSKFRCSVCDMLVCAFCSLKQHASEGVPPHYPCKYSPKFRKKLEASGRRQRLLKNKEDTRKTWLRSENTKDVERRTFKRTTAKVSAGEIAGNSAKHARLSTCYGWVQSPAAVIVAVWVQGSVEDVEVDLRPTTGTNEMTLSVRQSSGNFKAVLDGRKFWGLVDESCDVECATFDSLNVIALKVRKYRYGQLWPACFAGDSLLLRDAGDHDVHEWTQEDDGDIVLRVQVPRTATPADLAVDLSTKTVSVKVAGKNLAWTRHFDYDCLPGKSTWSLVDVDNRRVVEMSLVFSNFPKETTRTETNKTLERTKKIQRLFVEDEDRLFTLALAQVCARLEYGDRFMQECDLLPEAADIIDTMRGKNNKSSLPQSAFSSSKEEDTELIKTWYARSTIQEERAWIDSPRRIPEIPKRESVAKDDHDLLLRPTDGARGPPVKTATTSSDPLVDATPRDLFGDAVKLTTTINTFAWDDGGSSVKVYLSLPVDNLVVENVAVRFRPDRLLVQVKKDDTLFCFDTSLFQAVVPTKCSFKVVTHKKVVSLSLRKQIKNTRWSSLARDVNAQDTAPSQ